MVPHARLIAAADELHTAALDLSNSAMLSATHVVLERRDYTRALAAIDRAHERLESATAAIFGTGRVEVTPAGRAALATADDPADHTTPRRALDALDDMLEVLAP